MAIARKLAGRIAGPIATRTAPTWASGFVRQAFNRAVDGVGRLRGCVASAEYHLAEAGGDHERAIRDLIDSHTKVAGAQGFVTNLGGLVTFAVMVPANVSGLALLQCHLVGAIAHLRGYDLNDPRVRNAVIACMLGQDTVKELVKKKRLPGTPMVIATAPHHDPALDDRIAGEVAAELMTRVAGKRTATFVARRMPVVGGGVGAVSDGWSTMRVGKYAAAELRSRG